MFKNLFSKFIRVLIEVEVSLRLKELKAIDEALTPNSVMTKRINKALSETINQYYNKSLKDRIDEMIQTTINKEVNTKIKKVLADRTLYAEIAEKMVTLQIAAK